MVLYATEQKTFLNMSNKSITPTILFSNRSIDPRLPWSSYVAE